MPQTLAQHKQNAAMLSLLVALLVLILKLIAYYETNSVAILSDALETIVNVVTAGVAIFVVRIGSAPADENHPYGHGKAEYFSAAFEGGFIVAAALYIIYESIQAFFFPKEVGDFFLGSLWIGAATAANLGMGLYLKNVGKKTKSMSLIANGTHILSDVKTTVGVIIGLLIAHFTGISWLDSVIAFSVGVHLLYEGYKIVRESIAVLTDEVDEKTLLELVHSMEKNRTSDIIDVHQLKMIRSGPFHHVDAHLVLPEYWDISKAHEVSDEFEKKVVRDYSFDGEIAFHIDPCARKYCECCAVNDCPVRQAEFVTKKRFLLKSITRPGNF